MHFVFFRKRIGTCVYAVQACQGNRSAHVCAHAWESLPILRTTVSNRHSSNTLQPDTGLCSLWCVDDGGPLESHLMHCGEPSALVYLQQTKVNPSKRLNRLLNGSSPELPR